MIYDNVSIPWDMRNYLPKLYLIFRYIDNCIGSQYSTGRDYLYSEVVVSVGRIQSDYQEMFLEKINDSLIEFFSNEIYYPRDGSPCSEVRLCKYDELNKEQQWGEVRSRKIENLSACIQEVKDELEELEKTRFRERNDIGIQANIIPVVSDSPAIPAAVASVKQPIRQNENFPSTWIFAKDDGAVPAGNDSGAAGMIVAGNTARAADGIEALKNIFREEFKKLIEIGQQIANSLASINGKFPGKITDFEAIPPYSPTDIRWVSEKDYAKITGIKNLNSLRSRSKGGLVSKDGNSGIHGEHIWRAVGEGAGKNGRRIYYYIQDWLMIRLMRNINTPLT